ncbi:MAG: hypothetical protein D6741_15985 [Planctomycetota bacterium]|nr:MAG: hypothetical protein D6741_15985 [Planctomycetota bacterium]
MAQGDVGGLPSTGPRIGDYVAVGIGVVVCIAFVVMAFMGRAEVELSPDSLASLASQADSNINNTPAQPTRQVYRYSQYAAGINEEVTQGKYTLTKPFEAPLFQPKKKRGEPTVYPVLDLQGKGGHAAVPQRRKTPTAGFSGPPGYAGGGEEEYTGGEEAYGEEAYEGYPGYGGMGVAGQATEGVRYVVLTGLIDWEKQLEAYRETFENAMGSRATTGASPYGGPPGYGGYGGEYEGGYEGESEYGSGGGYAGYGTAGRTQGEMPQYLYVAVERAVVTDPNAPVDSLQWERINTNQRAFEETLYTSTSTPYVPREYMVPRGQVPITWPLRQLVGAEWGPEVAHEPEIPFMKPRAMGAYGYPGYGPEGPMPPGQPGAEGEQEQPAEPELPEIPEGPLATPAPGRPGMPGVPGAGAYGYPGYGSSGYPGYPGYGMGEGDYEGESEYGSGYGAGYGSGYGAGAYGPSAAVAAMQVKYKLFRFVDYKVEPGRKYRYRVKLYLVNPNANVDPRFLEDESLAEKKWLETEWSEPSPPIAVPYDADILAGAAKPGRIPYSGPKATVGVTVFDPEDGSTAFHEFADLDRGTVVNFLADEVKAKQPVRRKRKPTRPAGPYGSEEYGDYSGGEEEYGSSGYGEEEYGAYGSPYGPAAPKEEEEDIDYITNMLIVDILGGDPTPTRQAAPGEILLMDPDGNLLVRREVDDEEKYKEFTEEKTASPYGAYGPYGEGEAEGEYPEGY